MEAANKSDNQEQGDQLAKKSQQPNELSVGRFLSFSFTGTIETGQFNSVNDVYVKYSIVAGPDWLLSSGVDVGITQISRFKIDKNQKKTFVWNQPINVSYRSYNFYGWPQIVLSVYHFDAFGNDQILGYGCIHLPVANDRTNLKQNVKIYSPQSSSFLRSILSWIVGKRPELVDANLFARSDCRARLQVTAIGSVDLLVNITSKDVASNGFRSI